MHKLKFILVLIIIQFLGIKLYSQDFSIRMGSKMPYSVNLGYEVAFENYNQSSYYLEGFLTGYPFSQAQISVMNFLGADKLKSNVLDNPLYFGFGFEGGFNIKLGNSRINDHIIINSSILKLRERLITDATINDAFDVYLDSPIYPLGLVYEDFSRQPLSLTSYFINLGVGYSRTFELKRNSKLKLEIELKKTVFSRHRLYSDYRIITPVANLTDIELKKLMFKYGWFPSVNFYYVFDL